MEDKFEKKFKAYLPYIIVIAIIFLFLPCILTGQTEANFLTYVVYIGVLPLTALVCCLLYSYKHKNEFAMSLIAPILYIPSMFLYGNFRSNAFVSIVYLIAYFVCGFIGLFLGDLLRGTKAPQSEEDGEAPAKPKRKTASHVSRRAREEQKKASESVQPINEDDYSFGDESTTAEDIDAILKEIHERNN